MGRWSRLLAPRFVSWLDIAAHAHWLDVGCGTGSLVDAICAHADSGSVVGCDPSAPFIEFARGRVRDERASFVVASAGALPRRPGGFDCVASLLALNFFPDVPAALEEMKSAAADAATVSACVWDYAAGMEFLRRFWDAAIEIEATARILDEAARFPVCNPDALAAHFRGAGLRDVVCDAIEIPTVFTSFHDFWRPFLAGTGPAPSFVASLDPDNRAALSRALESRIEPASDGRIVMSARAWAVRGTVASR
jgi:SAM-dependent methyltransferase